MACSSTGVDGHVARVHGTYVHGPAQLLPGWRRSAHAESPANRRSLPSSPADTVRAAHRGGLHARRAQRRPAGRRTARRRPAAHRRRRRHRQDGHARAPRRRAHRARRRPAAHPAAHVHAPRRRRDAAPGRGGPRGAWAQRRRRRPRRRRVRARLGRHLPRQRRPPAAHPRPRHRHGARVHHHGPGRRGRSSARRPHAPRPRPRRRPLPAEVHLPRRLLALRQRAAAAERLLQEPSPGASPKRASKSSSPPTTDAKEHQNVLDYDDLLLFWRGLLADPAGGARVRERFSHVLVDEYQDTNALQADIVSLLRPDGSGGYRWSATTRSRSTPSAPPPCATSSTSSSATPARRSSRWSRTTAPPPILAATNALIAEAAERRDKELWTDRAGGGRPVLATCRDEDEQTQWVCERILAHRELGTELKQQAVLFRAQHHSMALEMELSRRNIPFHKYGGLRFVEMAHVKDLVSFLRLAENPRDAMAGLRSCSGWCRASGPQRPRRCSKASGRPPPPASGGEGGARVSHEPARAARPAVVELFATLAAAGPVSTYRHRCISPCAASRGRSSSAAIRQRPGPARPRADRGARVAQFATSRSSPSSPSWSRSTRRVHARTSPARRSSRRGLPHRSQHRSTRPRAWSGTPST